MKLKRCPRCRSTNLVRGQKHPERPSGTFYDVCRDCRAVWESIPAGEAHTRDGELMPFREACDNCAFRAGSPESQDKEEWKKLMEQLRAGGQFFCHKGVPLVTVGEGARASFEFPKRLDGEWDRDRMRLCRGFLNAWSKWVEREYGTHTEEKAVQ